jgi:hypothetical protein
LNVSSLSHKIVEERSCAQVGGCAPTIHIKVEATAGVSAGWLLH